MLNFAKNRWITCKVLILNQNLPRTKHAYVDLDEKETQYFN